MNRRKFLQQTSAMSAASLVGHYREASAEPPLGVSKIRLIHNIGICLAPQYLAHEFLKLEGFSEIEYVEIKFGHVIVNTGVDQPWSQGIECVNTLSSVPSHLIPRLPPAVRGERAAHARMKRSVIRGQYNANKNAPVLHCTASGKRIIHAEARRRGERKRENPG